ncbi:uncharacterized protein BJ212DRAFT_1317988 [Suillus subaureus]|uniref:Uncharacterized protein n=1 Tax=Suillus subaureus TaxID=48587 RepID=A0A9P7EMF6_9AGAM|nr:uncharacterized protein BJ212DRAFT_1317988 [Suillus subaureus]KAG1826085.1 hypothetical protein BJ212DRAFT_1317988 [Suillus subaureus]
MSDASSTCNLGYSFVSSAASSNNNCDVELILSDIPFISVGMLAFGVSAFFFVIRHFTLSIISLYFSVLLSFAAVVIDLTQILIRDMIQVTVQPLITAREVLLALSIGLRFLFYWLYVSEPPIGEPQPRWNNFLTLSSRDIIHSGSWTRWGVSGSYAKVALLATIPTITTLQIIWRVIQQYHIYGPVYAVNVTLEVVVSTLLLLKLLFNTIPTPSIARSHTFREYEFPILALMFNIGISAGNLILFAFTESILGRLLQAVELCILIVFMMILHFFRHKKTPATFKFRDSALLKVKLPEQARESTFRLSPPATSTPRVTTFFSSENQNRSTNADATRHSVLATVRCAPWVSWSMSHGQSNQDEEKAKLWDQGEARKGDFDPSQGSAGNHSMTSAASVTDKVSTEWKDIVNDSVLNFPRLSMLDAQSASTGSRNGSMSSGQIWHAVRADIHTRPHPLKLQTMSLITIPAAATSPNENGAAVIMTAPPDPPAQDSPIYAIKGFTPQPPQVPSRQCSSSRSLEELLELQNELDKTIATLRSFSPSAPFSHSPTSTSPTPTSPSSPSSSRSDSNQADQSRQSSSTGARTLSDFSLSNFPSPPWLASRPPSLPALLPAIKLRSKEDRRARLRLGQDSTFDTLGLPPPRIPAALADMPSSPRSDLTSDSPYQDDNKILPTDAGRSYRFDSGGTQYEITSFIGDLTTPDGHRNATMNKPSDESGGCALNLGIVESHGSREASPHSSILPFRSSPLGAAELLRLPSSCARYRQPQLSTQMRLSPVSNSEWEASDPGLELAVPLVQRRMRPLILPSMMITSPPHVQPLNVRSSRRLTGLPQRPRLASDSSVSRSLPEDVHAPGAFERPRPAPLILRSDDEYFSTGAR